MTPKEKAQELFGKYAMYIRANLRYDEEANEDAKQCALIAVDEIISNWIAEATIQFPYGKVINYWNVVKEEIEKL